MADVARGNCEKRGVNGCHNEQRQPHRPQLQHHINNFTAITAGRCTRHGFDDSAESLTALNRRTAMMPHPRTRLRLQIDPTPLDDALPALTHSYELYGGKFTSGGVAVLPGSVSIGESVRNVDPSTLRVIGPIGRGAAAYVQLAEHIPSGTLVALKCVSVFEKSKRSQLVSELRALFETQCDALVGFYGAYHADGIITIVLEYMDRGSLTTVLKAGGAWPEPALAGLAFQVLWGLAYLRGAKRLHRDVKPSNVLLSHDGAAKLSDFGLSTELMNSIGMAATLVGTCLWMSPERIQGKGASFASDIWAAGLLLYEAATGSFPYAGAQGSTYVEMAELLCETPPPALPATFPPALVTLVGAMMQRDPASRLPADVLLGSPWFLSHGVVDIASAREKVAEWLARVPSVAAPEEASRVVTAPARSQSQSTAIAAAPAAVVDDDDDDDDDVLLVHSRPGRRGFQPAMDTSVGGVVQAASGAHIVRQDGDTIADLLL